MVITICLLFGMELVRIWLTMLIIKYLNQSCKNCNARVKLGASSIEIETNNMTEKNAPSDED